MQTTRNLWPYGLILTFALFFCAMATVVLIAATHRETLVSDNYYEQEMKFQDHLDGLARARQSGATLNYDSAARHIVIALPAAANGRNLTGRIELYRPSAAGLDRQFKFAPDAGGGQSLDVSGLQPGLWEVRVAWNAGGQDYFLEQKIKI